MIDLSPDFPIIPSKVKPGTQPETVDQFVAPSGTMVQPKKDDLLGSMQVGANTLSQGSGNDVFTISSLGIQLGNAIFTSAPFSVTMAGLLTATNAVIIGNITANSGAIGGFVIGADYIRDAANSFGLASTVTGGDDVRFWAGDTFANRATADFVVFESGILTLGAGANKITLDGTTGQITTAAGTWSMSGDGTLIGTISRARAYNSAATLTLQNNSPWRIPFDAESYDGNSEFDSVYRNSTMTAGSAGTTLIDSTAAFTSDDVGKFVWINDGVTLAPHTITAFVSSTQLTTSGGTCDSGDNYRLYGSHFKATVAGRYLVTAQIELSVAAGSYNTVVHIYVNGSEVTQRKVYYTTAADGLIPMQISDIITLAASDKITIYATRPTGTSATINSGSNLTYFCVHRLS